MLEWVLAGALIIFMTTTLLADTKLGTSLILDQDVLFATQVASLLASIATAAGLLALLNPPGSN
jgi:hypothetical protein